MAAKSGENRNFSPLHRMLLYYPVGQKFARNRSISYGFRDIHTFLFSAKIKVAITQLWTYSSENLHYTVHQKVGEQHI